MSSPAEDGQIENLVWKFTESGRASIISLLKTFSLWNVGGKPVLLSLAFFQCACSHSTTGQPAKMCEKNSKDAATRYGSA